MIICFALLNLLFVVGGNCNVFGFSPHIHNPFGVRFIYRGIDFPNPYTLPYHINRPVSQFLPPPVYTGYRIINTPIPLVVSPQIQDNVKLEAQQSNQDNLKIENLPEPIQHPM